MGLSWKIEKENISLEDYNEAFGIGSHPKDESKYERAYEEASKVRQFEIQMYWERTKYFWAFIPTIYVAYYKVFVDIYEKKHGSLPLLVLACLGFIFSVARKLGKPHRFARRFCYRPPAQNIQAKRFLFCLKG